MEEDSTSDADTRISGELVYDLKGSWETLSESTSQYWTGTGLLKISSALEYAGHGYGRYKDGLVRLRDVNNVNT